MVVRRLKAAAPEVPDLRLRQTKHRERSFDALSTDAPSPCVPHARQRRVYQHLRKHVFPFLLTQTAFHGGPFRPRLVRANEGKHEGKHRLGPPHRVGHGSVETKCSMESSDDDEYQPTEVDLKYVELSQVAMQIDTLEKQLRELKERRRKLNEELDSIPGARYMPSSPSYSPSLSPSSSPCYHP